MMGHSPAEARARYDAVIEYAELGDYTDLKLKNYSSGMHVRLAFSLMLQADADILLVDEVLAVGDVAFQEKCIQSLEELKRNGVTIVLVTHDMNAIQSHCDRAMLIEDGVVDALGEAGAVASRYLELLFPIEDEAAALHGGAGGANFTDAWLSGANGDRVEKVGPGDSVTVNLKLQAREDISGLQALVELINNPEGVVIATFPVGYGGGEPLAVAAGEELTIRVSLERAPLAPGTYRFRYHLGTADRLFDRARSAADPAGPGARLDGRRGRAGALGRGRSTTPRIEANERRWSGARGRTRAEAGSRADRHRWRSPPLPAPALGDVADGVPTHLPRHGAGLHLVARAAAADLRGAAGRVHPGLPAR